LGEEDKKVRKPKVPIKREGKKEGNFSDSAPYMGRTEGGKKSFNLTSAPQDRRKKKRGRRMAISQSIRQLHEKTIKGKDGNRGSCSSIRLEERSQTTAPPTVLGYTGRKGFFTIPAVALGKKRGKKEVDSDSSTRRLKKDQS